MLVQNMIFYMILFLQTTIDIKIKRAMYIKNNLKKGNL